MADCTFLTKLARVLACLAPDPTLRLRTVAERIGITERTAHRIMGELLEAGYLSRERHGRRNLYEVHLDLPLRHPLDRDHRVGEVLGVLLSPPEDEGAERDLPVRQVAKRASGAEGSGKRVQ